MQTLPRSFKRLLYLVGSLPVVLVVLATLYWFGMRQLELLPRTVGESLQWAAGTLTTTGYGRDTTWVHPGMQAYVIFSQFAGVILIFLVVPVFVIPFLEERFDARLATEIPILDGHVFIFRYGPAVSWLIEALDEAGVPVAIFEEDESIARRLRERGQTVILGNLEEDDPDLTRLKGARSVVLNGDDDDNAAMALSARYHGFEGKIIARVENPNRRPPMRRAGATVVFNPEHVLAAVIAAQASDRIGPRFAGLQRLGGHLASAELRVGPASPLVGRTLSESGIRTNTGASVVAIWTGGEITRHPPRDRRLNAGDILVVVGSTDAIERLGVLATPVRRPGPFVVLGNTTLGSMVTQFLRDVGEDVIVVDEEAHASVDVVGDPMALSVLERAKVASARAIIIALPSDSSTLFAAAIVRSLIPDEVIIAGVSRAENVARIHRAGADFAPSLSHMAGQFLSFQIMGQRSVLLESEIRIVATAAGVLAGRPLDWNTIRRRTGCVVVAVERGEDVLVEFDAGFVVQPTDILHISGSTEMLAAYHKAYASTVLDIPVTTTH